MADKQSAKEVNMSDSQQQVVDPQAQSEERWYDQFVVLSAHEHEHIEDIDAHGWNVGDSVQFQIECFSDDILTGLSEKCELRIVSIQWHFITREHGYRVEKEHWTGMIDVHKKRRTTVSCYACIHYQTNFEP